MLYYMQSADLSEASLMTADSSISLDKVPKQKTDYIYSSQWGMVFLFLLFWATSESFIAGLIPVLIEGAIIFWYFHENNKTFDEINRGFQESLQEQMKSERMKVDLITNVSHDLKTPLTSIISYVDLLSKEELPRVQGIM